MFDIKGVIKNVIYIVLFSIVPILLFYLMEAYEHNAFVEVRPIAQIYNILLFCFLFLVPQELLFEWKLPLR